MAAIRTRFDFCPEARLMKEDLRSCLDVPDWILRRELLDEDDTDVIELVRAELDPWYLSNKPRP